MTLCFTSCTLLKSRDLEIFASLVCRNLPNLRHLEFLFVKYLSISAPNYMSCSCRNLDNDSLKEMGSNIAMHLGNLQSLVFGIYG